MNVKMDYQPALDALGAMINELPANLESRQDELAKQWGKILKAEVVKALPVGTRSEANYDGSEPHTHMAKDVKVSVKTRDGVTSVTVSGGKNTAYKWHMLDSGTHPGTGKGTRATHFVRRATEAAAPQCEELIDKLLKEVLK